MSNINELNQKIAILNADSQRVNNERAVNIGKHDTLSKQLDAAIKSYNEKYGKNITVETLEQEINAVTSAKEKEIADIEAVLNAIKSGDYSTANSLVNGESAKPTVPELGTETGRVSLSEPVITPLVNDMVTPPLLNMPVTVHADDSVSALERLKEITEENTSVQPVTPPVVQAVVPPVVAPPVVEPIAPPVVEPAQVTPPPVITPPPMVEPVTPPPIMTPPPVVTPPPVATEAPKSFSAILGGTAFGQ